MDSKEKCFVGGRLELLGDFLSGHEEWHSSASGGEQCDGSEPAYAIAHGTFVLP
jgi:hypothetical protein